MRFSRGDLVGDPAGRGPLDGACEGGGAFEFVRFGLRTSFQQGLSPDFLEDVSQETAGRGGLADAGPVPAG